MRKPTAPRVTKRAPRSKSAPDESGGPPASAARAGERGRRTPGRHRPPIGGKDIQTKAVDSPIDDADQRAPSLDRLEVTRAEALSILGGVAERTFARLESQSVITATKRGRGGRASVYDLRQLVPAYIGYVASDRPSDDRKARADRDQTQAELNKMKLARERGDLVPRAQVVMEGQAYTKAWTAKVRGLPRLMVQAGIIGRENEAAVAGMCRDILMEISRWTSVQDAERAATETGSES